LLTFVKPCASIDAEAGAMLLYREKKFVNPSAKESPEVEHGEVSDVTP
jgi:hypothetical protein